MLLNYYFDRGEEISGYWVIRTETKISETKNRGIAQFGTPNVLIIRDLFWGFSKSSLTKIWNHLYYSRIGKNHIKCPFVVS